MKYIGSDFDRLKPKKPGCSAIAMPSEPPVTSRHFSATENTSCEKASVSIRNGMPPVRTQKKPIIGGAGAGDDDTRGDAEPGIETELHAENRDRIGAEPEKGGVAERHQASEAEKEIKTHGENREDEDLRHQRARIVADEERQHDERLPAPQGSQRASAPSPVCWSS